MPRVFNFLIPISAVEIYDSKALFRLHDMRSLLTVAFSVALIAGAASAQSNTPTPVSDDVVKISTSLIRLDVTVTGKDGRPVNDLKPEDFEIYQDGVRQRIVGSNFVFNPQPKPAKQDKLETPIPEPPVEIKPENVKRTIALVVDDLTLSFDSVALTRRALKKFVDEQMQDGDLVAIIRTGAGIGALQQFTTDKRQLYAAIERLRWNPRGFGKVGAFAPLAPRTDPNGLGEDPVGSELDLEEEFDSLRESLFATGTLGAVNYVIRGMQSLPGRKSVLLLSDGFSLFTRDAGGATTSNRVLQSLRRLVDMANRASVVVYTMDARGLLYTGLTAADATGERTGEQLEEKIADRRRLVLDTQEGLRYLAKQTGGLSIIN